MQLRTARCGPQAAPGWDSSLMDLMDCPSQSTVLTASLLVSFDPKPVLNKFPVPPLFPHDPPPPPPTHTQPSHNPLDLAKSGCSALTTDTEMQYDALKFDCYAAP